MKYTAQEVADAKTHLKNFTDAPDGRTIYCVIRNVSRSGMSRRMDFYVIVRQDGQRGDYLQYLTGWMSVVLGEPRSDKGMRVNGCGMDMGFHMVDTLASVLYGRDERGLGKHLRHSWI